MTTYTCPRCASTVRLPIAPEFPRRAPVAATTRDVADSSLSKCNPPGKRRDGGRNGVNPWQEWSRQRDPIR